MESTVAKKTPNARERILNVAEQRILKKGYSATSIEEIIDAAHITKGGFFYHFKGKNALALALVHRYLEADEALFQGLLDRAEQLSEDPLQQMLLFIRLFAEEMEDMPNGHPGCLVASFIYESLQFEQDVLTLISKGVLRWREIFANRIELIQANHEMKIKVDIDELADNFTSVIEGAIVTSLTLGDASIVSKQLLHYRNYLRLLFGDVR